MIQGKPIRKGATLGGLLAGLLLLTACAEDEVFLAGERLPVRSVLQDPLLAEPEEGTVVPENQSRPISLPATSANAGWTQGQGTPQFRVQHPALRSSLQPIWSADIGGGDSRRLRITADPVVGNGRVFTLDSAAQVVATSTSGGRLWSVDLTPASDREGQATGGGLALVGDTLYVSVGYGVLAALDAATGGLRWSQDLDASGSGRPTVVGDIVYITAGDNEGWAVDRSSGRVLWRTQVAPSFANVLGAPAPAVSGSLALFGFGSR